MLINSTVSSFRSSSYSPFLHFNRTPTELLAAPPNLSRARKKTRIWTPQTTIKVSSASSSENETVTLAPPPTTEDAIQSASSVVRRFYEGINCHDLASVEDLIAENCVYEDLIFPRPFIGRKVPKQSSSLSHFRMRKSRALACSVIKKFHYVYPVFNLLKYDKRRE